MFGNINSGQKIPGHLGSCALVSFCAITRVVRGQHARRILRTRWRNGSDRCAELEVDSLELPHMPWAYCPVGVGRFRHRVRIGDLNSESTRAASSTNAIARRARWMRETGTMFLRKYPLGKKIHGLSGSRILGNAQASSREVRSHLARRMIRM